MKFRLEKHNSGSGRVTLRVQYKKWLFWRVVTFEYGYPDDFSRNPATTHRMYFYEHEGKDANDILKVASESGIDAAVTRYINGNYPNIFGST